MILASAVQNSLGYLIAGVLFILFAYTVVRAGSFAYFRTKLEYLRSVLKEINKG